MLDTARFSIFTSVVGGIGLSVVSCGSPSSPSFGSKGSGGTIGEGAGEGQPGSGGATVSGTGSGGQQTSSASGASGDSSVGGASGASGGGTDAGSLDTGSVTETTPPAGRKRYLYAGNGATVRVYDIDDGHKMVKSITPPHGGGDLRGICGAVQTHAFYLSYATGGGGRVVAVDMLTDTELWSQDMDAGGSADRGSVSRDGKKLYVPAGEDFNAPYEYVLDTADGKKLTQIMITAKAHDTDIGVSGKFAYFETKSSPIVSVVDVATDKIVKQLDFGSIVGPHVVDSSDKYVYGNVFNWFGFVMMDVTTGQVVAKVHGDDVNNGDGGGELRNHGIALKPDETELWLGSKFSPNLMVFDNTVIPPKQIKHFGVGGGYGNIHWITFSLDGSYVYPAPDQNSGIAVQVFDAKAYRPIGATLAYSEDMFEVDFVDGQVVAVGDQYGIGRKNASAP